MNDKLATEEEIKHAFIVCQIRVSEEEIKSIFSVMKPTKVYLDEMVVKYLSDDNPDIDDTVLSSEIEYSNDEITADTIGKLRQADSINSSRKKNHGNKRSERAGLTAGQVLSMVFEQNDFNTARVLKNMGLTEFVSEKEFIKMATEEAAPSALLANYIKEELPSVAGNDGDFICRRHDFIGKCNDARGGALPVVGRDFKELPRFRGGKEAIRLSDAIKIVRFFTGFTQEEFGKKIQLSGSSICVYELADYGIIANPTTIKNIANLSFGNKDENYFLNLRTNAIIERNGYNNLSEVKSPENFIKLFMKIEGISAVGFANILEGISEIRKYDNNVLWSLVSDRPRSLCFSSIEKELISDYFVKEIKDKPYINISKEDIREIFRATPNKNADFTEYLDCWSKLSCYSIKNFEDNVLYNINKTKKTGVFYWKKGKSLTLPLLQSMVIEIKKSSKLLPDRVSSQFSEIKFMELAYNIVSDSPQCSKIKQDIKGYIDKLKSNEHEVIASDSYDDPLAEDVLIPSFGKLKNIEWENKINDSSKDKSNDKS